MNILVSILRALRVVMMLLLFTLTIFIYTILETPYGLKLATTYVPLFLPFHLQIDNPRGSILGTVAADKVVYSDDTVVVTVEHATLRLQPWHLFTNEIKIAFVNADDVNVTILNSNTPSTMTRAKLLANLTLPFALNIVHADLKHVLVDEEESQPWVDLTQVKLSALMNGEPHFMLRAIWQQGAINLIPDLTLNSANAFFMVDGHLPNYKVRLNAKIWHTTDSHKTVAITGSGDFAQLNLTKLIIRKSTDKIIAPMQITWLPYFKWEIPQITGKINNAPVSGQLYIRKQQDIWHIDNSKIIVHDASLMAAGNYAKHGEFDFKLTIPHLETLATNSHGRIFMSGQWQGDNIKSKLFATIYADDVVSSNFIKIGSLQGKITAESIYPITQNKYWTQFTVNADAIAKQVNINNHGIDNANLHFAGALDGAHLATLNLQIDKLHNNDLIINEIIIDAKNNKFIQDAKIAINFNNKKLNSVITGLYKQGIWHGIMQSLQTNFNIRLQKPSNIIVTNNNININELCLAMNSAHLCSTLNWQKNKLLQATINGQNIPVKLVSQFFANDARTTGTFSLIANVNGDGNNIQTGKLILSLSKGDLIYNSDDTPIHLSYQASKFNVDLSAQGLTSYGELNILDQPPLSWQLSTAPLKLSDPKWRNTPIQGTLQFASKKLMALNKLYPQFKNIQGEILANIKISGSIIKPMLSGDLQFKNGSLDIPKLGLHLTPIELTAHASNDKITYDGKINANPGILIIHGYTDLSTKQPPTQLQITGTEVTVINTAEYKVSASPQLQLIWLNKQLNVTGQITIPSAKINPIDLSDTVTLSDDVVFVTAKGKIKHDNLPITSKVKIILGDNVYLKAKGLITRLSGSVLVTEDSNNTTTGIGQIILVDGNYKAHGQDLIVRTGRAMFTGGNVTNPNLYIEVVRTVTAYITTNMVPTGQKDTTQALNATQSEVIVGARITGSVDTPQITFFSEPSGLTQSQILSYLVLGKGQSSGSDLDTALLLKAVSFLDIGGEETAATKNTIQKDLGLDVGLQSQQEYDTQSQSVVNNTSLVLGKALSPKLFVDYSIGLIEPINILRIRYQLSKHFNIRSESNVNAQGVDIFYNIER